MIEQVARDSAGELRAATPSDVEAGLADLHVRQARHRRRAGVGAVAALAVAVGVGWTAGSVLTREDEQGTRPPPLTHRTDHSSSSNVCDVALVDCLGDRTYRIALTRPVRWQLPPTFDLNTVGGPSSLFVESYRHAGPTAGVSVAERVRAATPDGAGAVPSVADDPRSFVQWVADRPYLDASSVVQTELDGHRAWQVQVSLAKSAGPGRGLCAGKGYACHLITYQPGGQTTGIWADMAAEYTAFRVPGAGTTVVWSWIFTGDTRDLAGLDQAAQGLSWPSG